MDVDAMSTVVFGCCMTIQLPTKRRLENGKSDDRESDDASLGVELRLHAKGTLMHAFHLSFATPNFSQSSKFLLKSARRFGLETRLYTPDHPVVADVAQKYQKIMAERRGAGYWLWKPFIILDALNSLPEGTAVLYTDTAMTFIADPAPLISLSAQHPVCLFEMSRPTRLQGAWTKRDCFVEMDADTEEFWSLPQLWAGIQLYRAGPEAREFVSRLAEAMASEIRLTDKPNIHGLPNLPGFIKHRHDQSVLTILAKQHDTAVFRDPSQFGHWQSEPDEDGSPFTQTVFLHRQRNKSPYKCLKKRLRRQYTGGKYFI